MVEMATKRIMAIDPGVSRDGHGGAIAWHDDEGQYGVENICVDTAALCQQIRDLFFEHKPDIAYVERVYRSDKLVAHAGEIRGILQSIALPFVVVTPAVWMDVVAPDRTRGPEFKTERKNEIHQIVSRRFPDVRITIRNADAMAILMWGLGR